MSSIRDLHRLQDLDTELGFRREKLEEIQAQLDDVAALLDLRERLPLERHRLAEVERRQRSAEWEVESTRELQKSVDAKLYGGRVTNPKELVGLQEEATLLKARQRRQEDAVLEIMAELEERLALSDGLAQELALAEEERKSLEERLTSQQAQVTAEIGQLSVQRQTTLSLVPPKDVQLYEALFTTKQRRALARIERATCQGCRINLPMTVQQRVRTDQGLVQCPSCGRILFME